MGKTVVVLAGIVGLCFLSGCVAAFVGAGLTGGTMVGEDTIELIKETEFNHAWQMANETLKRMGTIKDVDEEANTIEAVVKGAKVKCVIDRVTPSVVKIQVSARKNLMPKIDIASAIINNLHDML